MSDRLFRLEEDVESARPVDGNGKPAGHRPAAVRDLRRLADQGRSAVEKWARAARRPRPAARAEGQEADIPLDPGAGGRSIDTAALEVADLIVSTTRDPVSRGIRAATGAAVSHASVYVGDGMVVEAVGSGVVLRPIDDALRDATVAVAFRYPELTEEQRQRVRDAAGQRIGKPYDYWGIVRQARFQLDARVHCRGLDGEDLRACRSRRARVNFGTADNEQFFCSELVVTAFREAGVPLVDSPPAAVAPGDIAELGSSGRLGYVGHLRTPMPAAQSVRPAVWAASVPLPDLSAWEYLINFRPPAGVVAELAGRGATVAGAVIPMTAIRVLDVAAGSGPINLDYYPVRVTRLPAGYAAADDLLQHVRVNLGSFLDPSKAEFEPYEPADGTRFGSLAPVGAVMRFKIKAPLVPIRVDDGAVVCAKHAPNHWVFTTVWTPKDLGHPVSGNREWGFSRQDDGSFVFYTRAADRATTVPEGVVSNYLAFPGGHILWLDFQQRLARFVTDNGGAAAVELAISNRYPWEDVKAAYYRPTAPT